MTAKLQNVKVDVLMLDAESGGGVEIVGTRLYKRGPDLICRIRIPNSIFAKFGRGYEAINMAFNDIEEYREDVRHIMAMDSGTMRHLALRGLETHIAEYCR
jgi:hypothetical protein